MQQVSQEQPFGICVACKHWKADLMSDESSELQKSIQVKMNS